MSFHWKRFWNLNTLGSSSLAKRMIHKFWTHLTLRPAGARYRALCKIVLNKRTTNPASREQIASQIRRNGSTRSCSVTALTPEDFWGNPRVANGNGQAGQLLSSLEQIAIPISRQLWRVFFGVTQTEFRSTVITPSTDLSIVYNGNHCQAKRHFYSQLSILLLKWARQFLFGNLA